jgi:NOL1/NOP2/fmu family ribosome biogenesis protein
VIPLKFFDKREKEKLLRQLKEQFGIEKIPWEIAKLGKERIILFSGDISEKEIMNIDRIARIEGIGLYFAKIDEKTKDLRLSIEGVQLMKEQITKNIFELDEKQAEQWMMGQELNIATGKKGFFIMKYKDDFLGTGKISAEKISNFIPKSRRLKYKEIKIEE